MASVQTVTFTIHQGNELEPWLPILDDSSAQVIKVSPDLPALSLPSLQDTLRGFEESRQVIDSIEDQQSTSNTIEAFLHDPGPSLQKVLEDVPPELVAEAYDHQIYLKHREPPQDSSTFFIGHDVNAPKQSQVQRAATLSMEAMDLARQFSESTIAAETLHDVPLTTEFRKWLFYATHIPQLATDIMKTCSPNETVTVTRRGLVFQISLPDSGTLLHFDAMPHMPHIARLLQSRTSRSHLCAR